MAQRPAKRAKLLSDDSSDDSSSDASGGVALGKDAESELVINEEYARRYEHNQKRAELHRLEEKYGPGKTNGLSRTSEHGTGENGEDDEEDSSSEEEEDDEGILASGALDDEVNATLEAIRMRDPRVYDSNAVFYTEISDDNEEGDVPMKNKEKPMYLRDYHRENLLHGSVDQEEEDKEPTYVQQQQKLKDSIVKQIHAAAEESTNELKTEEEDDDFLVAKEPLVLQEKEQLLKPSITETDIENADKDPEQFLSKFLESRAWAEPSASTMHPFESDDEEEERRAEEFEEAYNLRFENPEGANEKIVSHARDTAKLYSVRQETTNKRKRARQAEQEKKIEAQNERLREKAQLRKLRIEEAEAKLKKIKEAAGLAKRAVRIEEWEEILTEDWDDQRWEAEMKKKFGEEYYANNSPPESLDGDTAPKKAKKPKWNDDIDITDLVPDFDDEEDVRFSLSSDEGGSEDQPGGQPSTSLNGKQRNAERRKEREALKREARKERRRLEQLVDEKLDIDMALSGDVKGKSTTRFRYRDTSPVAFGLTPHEILMASDSQLNQFAGLKKMAAFRDPEKKKKDKKLLSKKARLRQWRKETFGDEQGPQKTIQDLLLEKVGKPQDQPLGITESAAAEDVSNIREGKRRRRRKSKRTGQED